MATQRNYAQQMDAVLAGLGGTRPRLLLHACCGPCSSAVLEQLCRYFEITVLYYNPNTWPAAEYYRRGEELQKFVAAAHPLGVTVVEDSDYEDMMLLIEMSEEEDSEETAEEIEEELQQFEETFEELRIGTLLTGPYDRDNAIVTLHAGAGGTESCDWTGMLYRMYTRWAEKKGYSIEELDYLEGDVAGVKGVTFEVKGENAYGYLRSEKGVHRLVRISPFNSAGKRQTSFASCDVIPDIEEDIDIEINDDDLKIDTYRSSGAGGQHINKTSSAVRITHLPTGIVVQCQNERSQHMNKDKAMQMLKSKLYLMKQQEQAEKMSDIRGEVRDINFGNQIRSYVMQPYTMVKDHRTNAEVSNVGGVMDGNIDPFINAYLSANTEQASEQ